MWKGSGGRKKNWREAEKVWCSPNKGLSQLQGKLQSQMTFQELNQVGQRDQALIRTWQQVLDTDHPERGGMTWDNVARSKANSWKKLIAGGCLPVVFPALGGRWPSDLREDLSDTSQQLALGIQWLLRFLWPTILVFGLPKQSTTDWVSETMEMYFFSSSVWLEVWDEAVRRADLSSWFIGDHLSPVSSHGLPRVCVLTSFIRTTVTLN